MKRQKQEGFLLPSSEVVNEILTPRYYDPRIAADLDLLRERFELVSLSQLVKEKQIVHTHGDYVPKIYYGTGPYPYVRTSDLANWEIKASPKHGVPESVYTEYAITQGVRPGDILFVHEGTYLIGAVAMVTALDGPMLYQHHLAKFTVEASAPFNHYYLLAAFESPLVHRQIRSKQFSADIIDSVVGRIEEVIIPFPKDKQKLHHLEREVEKAVTGRAKLREQVAHAAEEMDLWLGGRSKGGHQQIFDWEPEPENYRQPAFLGGRRGFSATTLKNDRLINDVLLPKYYDPWVDNKIPGYIRRCKPQSIGELVEAKLLSIQTGDEIGRLNYGTGQIPFVRTSDFGSWELKRETKQGVSQDVYDFWANSQDVKAGDILLVRDGTYLVGTSVMVNEEDLPLLYCGGIYKIRCHDHEHLPPGLLFALLNTPFVCRQIRNKQFTRDVIDTLGHRVTELVLPLPKDRSVRQHIGRFFDNALRERTRLRASLQDITEGLFSLERR